ncbi:MAG TPA: hypothetical protein DCS29_03695 [Candidatus Magasanikbacteria bacterium]|nr:MAG: hypothetical protein A2479_03090 [Candidatus Magasanikbacteria bacterium RIFOXYC2_FULL_39_8]HAT03846.1 hypothetical protein [Candidatus Magasanikbacteria bacterium]
MQKANIFFASILMLLALGAGCSQAEDTDNQTQTKPADTMSSDTTQTPYLTDTVSGNNISLSAQAVGKNTVQFEWNVGDEIAKQAEGWRIVYGKEASPTYPSTWWFERGKPHREKTWAGLPGGVAHFRLCAVIQDVCESYSNDVEVEILGETSIEDVTIVQ